MTRQDLTEAAVLEAIVDSDGNVARIARRLSCGRSTAQRRIAAWASTVVAFELAKPSLAILAYRKLREHVEDSQAWAIKYVLDNEGAVVGYANPPASAAAAAVANVNVNIHQKDVRDLTDDELLRIASSGHDSELSARVVSATKGPAESA